MAKLLDIVLISAFEVTFPLKKKCIKTNNKDWVTNELIEDFAKLRKCHTGSNCYLKLKNGISSKIAHAKKSYYEKIQEKIKIDPTFLYKATNNICNLKVKPLL